MSGGNDPGDPFTNSSGEVWVECDECGGDEGWVDGDGVWHECEACHGSGGHAE